MPFLFSCYPVWPDSFIISPELIKFIKPIQIINLIVHTTINATTTTTCHGHCSVSFYFQICIPSPDPHSYISRSTHCNCCRTKHFFAVGCLWNLCLGIPLDFLQYPSDITIIIKLHMAVICSGILLLSCLLHWPNNFQWIACST